MTVFDCPSSHGTATDYGGVYSPGAGNDPEACFLRIVEQLLKILSWAFEVEDSLGGRVVRPEEVDADGVEAIGLQSVEDIQPELGHGQPLVVELGRVDEDSRAID